MEFSRIQDYAALTRQSVKSVSLKIITLLYDLYKCQNVQLLKSDTLELLKGTHC